MATATCYHNDPVATGGGEGFPEFAEPKALAKIPHSVHVYMEQDDEEAKEHYRVCVGECRCKDDEIGWAGGVWSCECCVFAVYYDCRRRKWYGGVGVRSSTPASIARAVRKAVRKAVPDRLRTLMGDGFFRCACGNWCRVEYPPAWAEQGCRFCGKCEECGCSDDCEGGDDHHDDDDE